MNEVQLPQGYVQPLRGGSLLFTIQFPEIPGTHFRPQKDERLSRPWSHPVVLNMGPLDWENSALTTRPLLHTRHFPILSFSKWVAMCVLLVYTIPSVRMKRIAIAICDLFFHYCEIKEISFCYSCDTKPCAKQEKIHVNSIFIIGIMFLR